MTTLTLAKLAQIEAAFDDQNLYLHHCDPATVAALCRVAIAAERSRLSGFRDNMALFNALRAAGLLE